MSKMPPGTKLGIWLCVLLTCSAAVVGFVLWNRKSEAAPQGQLPEGIPSGIDTGKSPVFDLEDALKKKGLFVKTKLSMGEDGYNVLVLDLTCGTFLTTIHADAETATANKPSSRYGFAWKRYYFQSDNLDEISKLKRLLK